MRMHLCRWFLGAAGWALPFLLSLCPATSGPYEMGVFQAEVTVPTGHALMGGGIRSASHVVDPLLAKGVVLTGSGKPIVIVAVDWCEIRNDAYDCWREHLAQAAGTERERVLLASVHQHDAPVVDLEAQRLLDRQGLSNTLCDPGFHETAVSRVVEALRKSLDSTVPVTHFGTGQARVEKIASNRRVVLPDGTVSYPRDSATKDPAIRLAPVGTIDPWLKTLSFWNGNQPVAAISFYAVHPMSYYGRGGVSYDFVGMARERRQRDNTTLFQIYFSGCSGDVTAGKYNDGNPANRPILANRLYDAMVRAWRATVRHPLIRIRFRCGHLVLPPRSSPGFTEEDLERTLADKQVSVFKRNLAAMGLSWRKRVSAGQPIDVPFIDFGEAGLLFMPAETFVQYQIDAQSLRPGYFLAVAGYSECAPGYIPSRQAIDEGFIDSHIWCWVDPTVDEPMHKLLEEMLGLQ